MLPLSKTCWMTSPKEKGADIQHVQQRGFASARLVFGLNQLHIAQDFNGTPGDLSGDA